MDSSENQKAEVERIKQAVSQNFKSRRAFRIAKYSSSASTSSLKAPQRRQAVTSNSGTSRPNKTKDVLDESVHGIGDLQLGNAEDGTTTLPNIESWHGCSEAFRLTEPQNDKGTATGLNVDQDSKKKVYPFSFYPDAPLAENELELSLILNYLDNIFPLQYYFYQSGNSDRGRGWLLSLLLRAKSSYFTALAFSCLSQLLLFHQGDIQKRQRLSADLDGYHARALSELQAQLDILPTLSGYEHLKLGVEILACMMQMLSIEVFRETKEWEGWKDDWEVHLQAAGTLLSVVGTDLPSNSPGLSFSGKEEREDQAVSSRTNSLLPLNEIAGLDFFLTAYMWGDICRCASIGPNSASKGPFHYLIYLEEDRVKLDSIMGCRNWAMIAIKKISNLENWKHEKQQSQSLSIPALSRQGAQIEEHLQSGLKTLCKDKTTLSIHEQECNLVTELYALSALTYLAVAISGNSFLLPEVRSSVPSTLRALKALPQHLLIRVSLPFCVAGCMADDPQKEDFRRILLDAHAAGHLLGTLWNGLDIMEEFWRLREDIESMRNATKCAWTLAMDSLGTKILLI